MRGQGMCAEFRNPAGSLQMTQAVTQGIRERSEV